MTVRGPAAAAPQKTRPASKTSNVGANVDTRAPITTKMSEAYITGLRPNRSANGPQTNVLTPIAMKNTVMVSETGELRGSRSNCASISSKAGSSVSMLIAMVDISMDIMAMNSPRARPWRGEASTSVATDMTRA